MSEKGCQGEAQVSGFLNRSVIRPEEALCASSCHGAQHMETGYPCVPPKHNKEGTMQRLLICFVVGLALLFGAVAPTPASAYYYHHHHYRYHHHHHYYNHRRLYHHHYRYW